MLTSINIRAALVSIGLLVLLLSIWEATNQAPDADKPLTEYEMLMGGSDQEARVPPPSAVIGLAVEELSNPFYDAGPNDKGIGIQLAYSIYRVLTGFFLASLLAIPVGFLIGMFVIMYFFLIRPQVKRQKEHKAMVEALKKGDEIQTMGGLMGKITKVGESFVTVFR